MIIQNQQQNSAGESACGTKMRNAAAAVTVALLSSLSAAAQYSKSPIPSNAEIRNILVNRVDKYQQSVGMVVGVLEPRGRRIVSYGRMSKDDSRPVDGDTLLEIGSITKTFTALLLAGMVERGEVSLSDPVAKYLPPDVRVPQRAGRQITLQDLSTHRSGLPTMPVNTQPASLSSAYSPADLYRFLSSFELKYDIGSRWEYSNLGFGLLGEALARRAGTSYASLVAQRITGPLGMKSTYVDVPLDALSRLAQGYTVQMEKAPEIDLGVLAGAGNIRSTANDMLSYLSALLGESNPSLSAATAKMLSVRSDSGQNFQQALGWTVRTPQRCANNRCKPVGDPMIVHTGVTDGFTAFAGMIREAGVGVIVLSNARVSDLEDIGAHLLLRRIPLRNGKSLRLPVQRKAISVDASLLTRYAGRYQFPDGGATVSIDNGRLVLSGDDDSPDFFVPESERDFFSQHQDLQMHFQLDAQGAVTGFIFTNQGRQTVVKRVD